MLEDLAVYFTGGNSLIGYIIDHLDELKEKFNIKIDASGFKDLGDAIGKLIKSFTGSEDVKTGLARIGEGITGIGLDSLSRTVKLLSTLAKIIGDLISLKWDDLGGHIKEFFEQWADGVKHLLNLETVKETGDKAADDKLADGGSKFDAEIAKINAKARQTPGVGFIIHLGDIAGAKLGIIPESDVEYYWGSEEHPEAGIINTAKKRNAEKKEEIQVPPETGIIPPVQNETPEQKPVIELPEEQPEQETVVTKKNKKAKRNPAALIQEEEAEPKLVAPTQSKKQAEAPTVSVQEEEIKPETVGSEKKEKKIRLPSILPAILERKKRSQALLKNANRKKKTRRKTPAQLRTESSAQTERSQEWLRMTGCLQPAM